MKMHSVVQSNNQQDHPHESNEINFPHFEELISDEYNKEESQRASQETQISSPASLWIPQKRRSRKSIRFFKSAQNNTPFDYSTSIATHTTTPLILGMLTYQVERELVLSIGNRLTEIGEQEFIHAGKTQKQYVNLQEIPQSNNSDQGPGTQIALASNHTYIDEKNFSAAFIPLIKDEFLLDCHWEKDPKKRIWSVQAKFKWPSEITWDKKSHQLEIQARFKVPKKTGNNLESQILKWIGFNNGRVNHHYQDKAAASILLQEITFAKPKSIQLKLDGLNITPDRFLGKPLVMLLSQTAGGIFEREFIWDAKKQEISQLVSDNKDTTSPNIKMNINTDNHQETWQLKYSSVNQNVNSVYDILETPNGTFRELKSINVTTLNKELLNIKFLSSPDRGIRDLSVITNQRQTGVFKIQINQQDGFGYGEFIVSPTTEFFDQKTKQKGTQTKIELFPKYSKDLARKKIILYVVQLDEKTFSKTQVVPVDLVYPPDLQMNQ